MMLKRTDRGILVSRLQEGLAFLGYSPGPVDGIFGQMVESSVCKLQRENHIFEDGIFGENTAEVYNGLLLSRGKKVLPVLKLSNFRVDFKKPVGPITQAKEVLGWKRCPADKFEDRGGYTRTTLRSDTAEAYTALYDEVHALGGVVTSAGGRRSLASKASPSRSKKSMHYVGRAFDMALPTGMRNVETDPFLVEKDSGRKWTVWCRTEDSSVPTVNIKACWVTSKKNVKGKRYTQIKSKNISVRAFNFTELAKKHGFNRISARRSFFNGGSYGGAEWWHFQWETGLIKGATTFGEELLKCYTREGAEKFVYWDSVRNSVFGVSWF